MQILLSPNRGKQTTMGKRVPSCVYIYTCSMIRMYNSYTICMWALMCGACAVSVWWGLASWSHCCRRFWLTWMAWRLKGFGWEPESSQHAFVESCDASWKFDHSHIIHYHSFHSDCIFRCEIIPFPAETWAIKPRTKSIGKRRGRRCHRSPGLVQVVET